MDLERNLQRRTGVNDILRQIATINGDGQVMFPKMNQNGLGYNIIESWENKASPYKKMARRHLKIAEKTE